MSMFKIVSRPYSITPTDTIKLLFKRSEKSFDSVLKNVRHLVNTASYFKAWASQLNIINCENGRCLAELKIEENHTNPMRTLHGGLSSTLIDTISSWALLSDKNSFMMPSVSVDLHLSFLKGAALGDEIIVDAETLRTGKTLAFLKCTIKNKKTGETLVEANHVKCYMKNAKSLTTLLDN